MAYKEAEITNTLRSISKVKGLYKIKKPKHTKCLLEKVAHE